MHHGLPPFGIGDCRHTALGLVQRQVDVPLGSVEQTPIDFDVIALEVGFRAEFGDSFAVHGDPALNYQFLGFAATGDAGL
jgi:hypothetical protein